MDLMKAGETIMRSSHSLMPFLAPTAYGQPARRAVFSQCCAQPMRASASRSFATSMRRRQDDSNAFGMKSSPASPDSPAKTTTVSQDISSILGDAVDTNKRTSTTPSRSGSSSAQSTSPPPWARPSADRDSNRTSMDDLMMQFTAKPNSSKRDVAGSLNPRGNRSGPPPVAQPAPMKLGPTLGRTIYVDNSRGFDIARAIRAMETTVGRNGVRRDFHRQLFHERGGTKRKRLHSERWRKRFKHGFQATVKRVLKMKKQGW